MSKVSFLTGAAIVTISAVLLTFSVPFSIYPVSLYQPHSTEKAFPKASEPTVQVKQTPVDIKEFRADSTEIQPFSNEQSSTTEESITSNTATPVFQEIKYQDSYKQDIEAFAPRNKPIEKSTSTVEWRDIEPFTTPVVVIQEEETPELEESIAPREFWLDSRRAYGSQAAIDAGGIIEVYPGYYASHNYDEGAIFYEFEVGDIVHIGGYDVTLEGMCYSDYNEADVVDTRRQIGYDKLMFQTCLGSGSEIMIWYGTIPGAYFDVFGGEDEDWAECDLVENLEAARARYKAANAKRAA